MERNIDQYAEGSNIQQAGGDIYITAPQSLENDNLIPCPECGHEVSPSAYSCIACGFPVLQYFCDKARRERDERLQRICAISLLCGIVGIFIISNFTLPETVESIISAVSVVSFILGYLICFHH
jgi:hypothetical protein